MRERLHERILHGCDYNPEQWIDYPEILEQDIEYMKKANMNVMSVGIFSWALLEPEEGVFDFGFMDRVIEKLGENGIKIILATPSAAKPRWLAEKYPEVLRVLPDGKRLTYGERHNHCYSSPIYREKTAIIDKLLAERYSSNENVILWHISNEFGGECHCELCRRAFRDYLKKRYDNDLKKLNHAWWSSFWSHNVTDWGQIDPPSDIGDANNVMTGLYMDWRDFVTYQTTEFMRTEIEAVRRVNPDIPVTTNFMGPYQSLDYHYMKNFIDVVSWDSYPTWHSDRGDVYEGYSIAFAHDLNRGLKKQPFLLMESTPSLTNWHPYNKLKKPNMHKLSSVQAIAHGSDSVQYFQWRKGRGGQEKFHGAVIDHNGKADGRVFNDVKNLGETLKKINEAAGMPVRADAAVVYEFRNRWAIDNCSGFCISDKKYKRTCINHYKELWKRGINADVIGINSSFDEYKLLILPMLYSVSEEQAERICSFVKNGGVVVAGYLLGYVNETDLCYMGGFPGGKLKEAFGLTADEIDTLYPRQRNSVKMNGRSYEAVDYCEQITPNTAEVLGIYEQDFYKGTPAVLKNSYGRGKTYYIACRDSGELLEDLYAEILKETQIAGYDLPCGVTIHSRESEDKKILFIENYNEEPKSIVLSGSFADMETGEECGGQIAIGSYGVRILKIKKKEDEA